jgi:hypothetical protein
MIACNRIDHETLKTCVDPKLDLLNAVAAALASRPALGASFSKMPYSVFVFFQAE